ncbi:MAG TPA: MerR family transcriptional regulator [Mycobacteriales bacterium]|nr:MerR family transcriptional regulator [Mycobacteriales bacterium]
MSAAGAHARSSLSIGEVLGQLRPEFPDITISKIRFLEAEGLIHPERTPSGYRKFSAADVARLRFVLAEQRDHYLPLRVIKEHLDAVDRGLEPPEHGPGTATRRGPRALSVTGPPGGLPGPEAFRPEPAEVRLTRDELLAEAGLEPEQLDQLEQFGLLARRGKGGTYDGDALTVAACVAEMARYGIEARHLRAYRTAADREIGLFEQVVTPLMRQRNPEARGRAEEAVRELAALSVRLHATLVRAGLRAELGG